MSYTSDFIEKVKNANNIVDVAGSYLPIKQKGRQWWACCPFHHEKTPSFAIYPDTQSYYCYGCHVSGGVFKLVEQLENVEFPEAVEILAKRAGIPLPAVEANPKQIAEQKKRARLLEIVDDAREFYCSHLSAEAKEYLKKRGISDELVKEFNIGSSPNWDDLVAHLKKKGYNEGEMFEAGVVARNEKGKYYDAMAKRITFSVFDLYGNCIAFTGRIMPSDDNGQVAKYRNTAQTLLYDKGKTIYGGDVLKKYVRQHHIDNLIVVEGNVDVITLVGAGFQNTVATMGTAMTLFHAKAFARFVKEIYLCYDGDEAGRKATLRSLDILSAENLDVRVVNLPMEDPDNYVKKNGAKAFQVLLDEAKPAVDHKLDVLAGNSRLNDNIGKSKYLKSAVEILKTLTPLEVELYVPKVARTAGVTGMSVLKAVGVTAKSPKIEQKPEKIPIPDGISMAKEFKKEIDEGHAQGTKSELLRLKTDAERKIEADKLRKYRDETPNLPIEEIQRVNLEIKKLEGRMK